MEFNTMSDFGSGPSGEMISGTWINRKSGQKIVVRDSFIDDSNNMFLNTSIGQLSMNEFSRDYIQASDEIYDEQGKVIEEKPVNFNEVSFAGNDEPLEADPIFANQGSMTMGGQSINNFELIDKIFKKTESRPEANLSIKWADFPEKELSMLVSYFDVQIEDIAAYIGKYLINEDLLRNALADFINAHLS